MLWLQSSGMWCARKLLTRDGSTVSLGTMLTSSGVDLLAPVIESQSGGAARLAQITVWETEKTSATYPG